jgi:hypothetical protein
MSENWRLSRFYLLLLLIVTIGRWVVGNVLRTPYELGTHTFSLVTFALASSIFYGAFCRRWRRFRLDQAASLGMMLGVEAQILIFVSTVASYTLGIDSYFNHPSALNPSATTPIGFGAAVASRMFGLVANALFCAIAGALGWALGVLLPE